jgi:hypothetical protein
MFQIKNTTDFKDLKALTEELYALDVLCFRQMNQAGLGKIDEWVKILKSDLTAHQMLVLHDKIVGYIHMAIITKKTYDLFIDGKLSDGELKLEDMDVYDKPKPLYVYALSLVIHPREQSKGYSRILWRAAKERLKKRIEEGYTIQDAITVAWTPEMSSFLHTMEAVEIKRDRLGNKVFRLRIKDGNLFP